MAKNPGTANRTDILAPIRSAGKRLLAAALVFLSGTLSAETFAGRRIFSFDLGYLGTGIKNNGWGLGVNYEIQCLRFFSVRPGFSHMTIFPSGGDIVCTTVGIRCDILFYPFFRGLEGPYLGGGISTEFVQFKTDLPLSDETAVTAGPLAGWKFSIFDYVFIDVFAGYSFLLNEGQFSSAAVAAHYGDKAEYGIKVKINLKKLWRTIVPKKKPDPAEDAGQPPSHTEDAGSA